MKNSDLWLFLSDLHLEHNYILARTEKTLKALIEEEVDAVFELEETLAKFQELKKTLPDYYSLSAIREIKKAEYMQELDRQRHGEPF
jgi:hypothetical protein